MRSPLTECAPSLYAGCNNFSPRLAADGSREVRMARARKTNGAPTLPTELRLALRGLEEHVLWKGARRRLETSRRARRCAALVLKDLVTTCEEIDGTWHRRLDPDLLDRFLKLKRRAGKAHRKARKMRDGNPLSSRDAEKFEERVQRLVPLTFDFLYGRAPAN